MKRPHRPATGRDRTLCPRPTSPALSWAPSPLFIMWKLEARGGDSVMPGVSYLARNNVSNFRESQSG